MSEQANWAVGKRALQPMRRAQPPMLEEEVAQKCQAEGSQVARIPHPTQVLVLQARLAMLVAAMVAVALWVVVAQEALC